MLQSYPTLALSLVLAVLAAGATISGAAAVGGSHVMLSPAGASLGGGAPSNGLSGMGSSGVGVGDFGDFGDGMGPPDPSKFRTPEELKEYLERLQLYYALVGRPRFGKRSSYFGHRGLASLSRPSEAADDADEEDDVRSISRRAVEVGKTLRDRIRGLIILF